MRDGWGVFTDAIPGIARQGRDSVSRGATSGDRSTRRSRFSSTPERPQRVPLIVRGRIEIATAPSSGSPTYLVSRVYFTSSSPLLEKKSNCPFSSTKNGCVIRGSGPPRQAPTHFPAIEHPFTPLFLHPLPTFLGTVLSASLTG